MNRRDLYNRFRLHRGILALALIGVLVCGFAWAALIVLDHYRLSDFDDSANFLVTALVFLALIVGVAVLNRRSIAYEMKRNMAIAKWTYNDVAAAKKHLMDALEDANAFRQDDPRRGQVFRDLALVARQQGHFDDAEALGKQALSAIELAWGAQHPEAISALEDLAATYRGIARYAQARPLLEDALNRREARADLEPDQFVNLLNTLGEFWLHLERPDIAEKYLRRGHAASRLPLMLNLSKACGRLRKLDEADALVQEACALARRTAPPHSLAMASCLTQLAEVRHRQGNQAEAEANVRSAIAILQELSSNSEAIWHDQLHLLGDILRTQGRWADAEECYQKALQFRDEYLAPEDLATARLLEVYSDLLQLMNRGEEAHVMEHRAKFIRDIHSPFRIV